MKHKSAAAAAGLVIGFLHVMRNRWLMLIWLSFIVRGVFYCTILPLWEGFDEWAYFGVAQHISLTGNLIVDRDISVSKEVDASLQFAPLPRGMTRIIPPAVTREAYWKLPPEERARREQELRQLPGDWAAIQVPGGMPAYEASQPPLYYWLIAIPLRLLGNARLLTRVWLVRILTLILGSFAIPIGFLLARRILAGESAALWVSALVALMPELAINVSRVSNEALAIVIYTALLLAVSSWMERPLSFPRTSLVGVLLGLGLLTKAYFLTAIPALALVQVWALWHQGLPVRSWLKQAGCVLVIAGAIAGWWYARNYIQTGTLSGLDEALMLRNTGSGAKMAAAVHVHWIGAASTILLSHVWYGGWSLLKLPRGIYYVTFLIVAMSCYGFVRSLKQISTKAYSLLSFYAWFWVGQLYQVVMLFLSKSSSTAMGGWYLYALIWAEAILFFAGIFALTPERFHKTVRILLIIAVAAVDLYSVHFVSIPYYADVHHPFGADGLSRLLTNAPLGFGIGGLLFLWSTYLVGTIVLMIAGFGFKFTGFLLDSESPAAGIQNPFESELTAP